MSENRLYPSRMKIFAKGEAQKITSPGKFLENCPFGRVVGVVELGANNAQNNFGWCGVKAIINVSGENYIIDFPEEVRFETDDGLAFLSCDKNDPNCWHPSLDDVSTYNLYVFKLN